MALRDSHVVKTRELSKFLEEWVEKHEGRFPKTRTNAFRRNQNVPGYSALSYLADHMKSSSFSTNYRRLERIRKHETTHTTLRIADDLLTAMECSYLLDNEIEVFEAVVVDRRIAKYRKPAIA